MEHAFFKRRMKLAFSNLRKLAFFKLRLKLSSKKQALVASLCCIWNTWSIGISLDSSQKHSVCGRAWVFRLGMFDGCALPSAVLPKYFQESHRAVLLNRQVRCTLPQIKTLNYYYSQHACRACYEKIYTHHHR